jgi:hypothetical protein
MKGKKIGVTEVGGILFALIVLSAVLDFFVAGSIILAILAFNAYLLRKERKNGK